ncbi:copper homeostasis protein CutC [Brevibacillus sp. SYSU BS000544]
MKLLRQVHEIQMNNKIETNCEFISQAEQDIQMVEPLMGNFRMKIVIVTTDFADKHHEFVIMRSGYMIEIIATTPDDALCIEACGADRIELISAFSEGGLTPSYGMIEKVVQAVKIPVNVMIRPHAKSFVYSKEEIDVMKKDITVAKELGANGVVFGVLNERGEICEESIKELIELCNGLDITFHKAIDELSDILYGVKVISKYPQIKTVLTSGGKGSITENSPIIKEMIKSSGHINVMLGGGLNFENAKQVIEETGASEYHFGTAVRYNKSVFGDIDKTRLKDLIERLNTFAC